MLLFNWKFQIRNSSTYLFSVKLGFRSWYYFISWFFGGQILLGLSTWLNIKNQPVYNFIGRFIESTGTSTELLYIRAGGAAGRRGRGAGVRQAGELRRDYRAAVLRSRSEREDLNSEIIVGPRKSQVVVRVLWIRLTRRRSGLRSAHTVAGRVSQL